MGEAPSMNGKKIGEYSVTGKLGAGGMGTVYKAYDASLERYVAIKTLSLALRDDEECVERFLREARSIAALRHPNLMHVYSVGNEEGLHYFAMEFIEGEPLTARLRREGRLPVKEAANIALQVMSALQKVHDAGIVHRDLKPGNIMMDTDNRAILVDFGLSKDTSMVGLTHAGTILGTPDYMAPEQIEGDEVGPPTDLYALGVVLYEMLSGELPFHRNTAIKTLRAHCEEDPVLLHELCVWVPEEVSRVIHRAMARAFSERYASAAEMAKDLKLAVRGAPSSMLAASGMEMSSAQTVVAEKKTPTLKKSRAQTRKSEKRPQKSPSAAKPKWLVPALVAGVVLLGIGYFLIGGGGEETPPTKPPSDRQPKPFVSGDAGQTASADKGTTARDAVPKKDLPVELYEVKEDAHAAKPIAADGNVRIMLKNGTVLTGKLESSDRNKLVLRQWPAGNEVHLDLGEIRFVMPAEPKGRRGGRRRKPTER